MAAMLSIGRRQPRWRPRRSRVRSRSHRRVSSSRMAVLTDKVDPDLGTVVMRAGFGAVTFVVAEAVIAGIWRRRPGAAAVASTAPDVTSPARQRVSDAPVGAPRGLARPAGRAALAGCVSLPRLVTSSCHTDPMPSRSEFVRVATSDRFVSEVLIWIVVGMVAAVIDRRNPLACRPGPRWSASIDRSVATVGRPRPSRVRVIGASVGFVAMNAYYLIVHSGDDRR